MKKQFLIAVTAAFLLASCAGNPEGKKAETNEIVEHVVEAVGETFVVDAAESTVQWKGTKVTGAHEGTITIKEGALVVDGGKVTGGTFVLDMNSISSTDLEGEWKEKLDGHLKSEDFFDVANNPEAKFEITGVEKGAEEGDAKVSGNLTIKGITKNISFDAKAVELTDSKANITANFNIVRGDWGVNYAGKEDDLISKEINFNISLVAKK
ncbi:YceI family protein [Sphingobacterium sp. UT-1RO-CII-1]|uniref:YceI family protein n=1 Tax=Sphingobacterium sp. UT-1RO-CII-1 TaxID=2995225 RepID=UPI00227C8E7D|nr:YceI family protein [Sphingobacterium sp. UT-1RO-CII-1]MCY4779580.1 YceI family protein [Sphingobacterium sp. UT-1RO-CII-1]